MPHPILYFSKLGDAHCESERPSVSVIVVVYNMGREAPRTLFSLSAAYQRRIAAERYEVIVVDNGSAPPLDHRFLETMEGNYRVIRMTTQIRPRWQRSTAASPRPEGTWLAF